jgi:hypothetical protein
MPLVMASGLNQKTRRPPICMTTGNGWKTLPRRSTIQFLLSSRFVGCKSTPPFKPRQIRWSCRVSLPTTGPTTMSHCRPACRR